MNPNNPTHNFNPNANSYTPWHSQLPYNQYPQSNSYEQTSYPSGPYPNYGINGGNQNVPVQQPYIDGGVCWPPTQMPSRGGFHIQRSRGYRHGDNHVQMQHYNMQHGPPPPPSAQQSPNTISQSTAASTDQSKLNKPALNNSAAEQPASSVTRKGGAVLSIGLKSKTAKGNEDAKASEVEAASSAKDTAEPCITSVQEKNSTITQDDLREPVRKEVTRQRENNTKQYARDPRPHFNIVFCGHVDAGKSTISGHLLMEKGLVDEREMAKLRRKAETHHREGWEFAYVMDVSEEEQSKGITRETGAAYIETEKRRITILDAPGHKAFVPSMIGGATQADVCVLVISSRTGEFETGFERGGQTREHTTLVRTCGVKQMICVINKMDAIKWSKERYDEIVGKLRPFLRLNGYEEKNSNLIFIPMAGFTGDNLIKHVHPSLCAWYKGPTMMEVVDNLTLPESRSEKDVLCIPLIGSYKDDGKTFIYGKVESGSVAVNEKIQILPGKAQCEVEGISIETTEFEICYPGDNVHLRVRGIDEADVHPGYVATSISTTLRPVEFLQARIVVLEVKNIISAGYRFMIHIHAAQEEASFHQLLAKLDRKTGKVIEEKPVCAKAGEVLMVRIELERPIVCETHKAFDKMGRFMLREDGKTFAIGLITKLYKSTHQSLDK